MQLDYYNLVHNGRWLTIDCLYVIAICRDPKHSCVDIPGKNDKFVIELFIQFPGIAMTSPLMIHFLYDFEWWFAAFRWSILAWCLFFTWGIVGHLIVD